MTVFLSFLCAPSFAQSRQIEIGVESFAYRSATTPLNRDNVLGLDSYPGLGRLAVGWRETHGGFRPVFRGYGERGWGTAVDETAWVIRQGYAQYWWGETVGLRVGKQRIAWGSGFAWNPTNRLEPPKNALNTTLEQEGALAARLDWNPATWASLVLVGATTDAVPRDLRLTEVDPEGFVGSQGKPVPLSREEFNRIDKRTEPGVRAKTSTDFVEGMPVKVTSGPFGDFDGVISEVNVDQAKVKVMVSIFGRETPVELGFEQVARL